ncbi:MAG: hypothetical protein DRO43_01120 [Candidatus Hecatellales archaeon]|nr:MAG: hypothetical protein DRO43_01120 [Candidatus Hecatellales archaeon]
MAPLFFKVKKAEEAPKTEEKAEESSPEAEVREALPSEKYYLESYAVNPPFVYVGIVREPETGIITYKVFEPTMAPEDRKVLKEIIELLRAELEVPVNIIHDFVEGFLSNLKLILADDLQNFPSQVLLNFLLASKLFNRDFKLSSQQVYDFL